MSALNRFKKADLELFLAHVSKYKTFDVNRELSNALQAVASGTKKDVPRPEDGIRVEEQWYQSLASGTPDYSVYDDPFYVSELWSCWVIYSRKSLLSLANPKSTDRGSVISCLGPVRKGVDLGCGMGYTTSGLKELFPNAEVCGTNLPFTFQFKVARDEGAKRGFSIYSDTAFVGHVDLVFASESFEHIQDPIAHLDEVVAVCQPRVFVLANSFTPRAIGHFPVFNSCGVKVVNTDMGRLFGKRLEAYGYRKMKANIWNSKPSIWVRE